MAAFDPYLAMRRFGTGLAPGAAPLADPGALLDDVTGPDVTGAAFKVPSSAEYRALDDEMRVLQQARRDAPDADARAAVEADMDAPKKAAGALGTLSTKMRFARGVGAPIGFRERLDWFWADHFTVRAVGGLSGRALGSFVDEAIRPHLAGRFADMLKAVVQEPIMLRYLDQDRSAGPNSRFAKRRDMGLNENYARELIELHTLGAGASYEQADVTELARLLAGLSVRRAMFDWQPGRADPGEKRVLGKVYGSTPPVIEDVFAVLEDLAIHPETARHLALKLAVHFVADRPDPGLITHMAARYTAAKGDLSALYAAMLEHPAAWVRPGSVKWPVEYVVSGLKALGVGPDTIVAAPLKELRRGILVPMRLMGQNHRLPDGPDGWAELDSAWITPQGIAGRIQWAMNAPERLVPRLPDPRDFVETALGPTPDEAVRFAAHNAENQREGVGLVLASAAFQRR